MQNKHYTTALDPRFSCLNSSMFCSSFYKLLLRSKNTLPFLLVNQRPLRPQSCQGFLSAHVFFYLYNTAMWFLSYFNARYNLELRDFNAQCFQIDYYFVLVILRVPSFQLLSKLQAFKALHRYFVFKKTRYHFYYSWFVSYLQIKNNRGKHLFSIQYTTHILKTISFSTDLYS